MYQIYGGKGTGGIFKANMLQCAQIPLRGGVSISFLGVVSAFFYASGGGRRGRPVNTAAEWSQGGAVVVFMARARG
jgi:hypothetical protein